jgi:hypothetical protein
MFDAIVVRLVRAGLLLEALSNALWVFNLAGSLGVRDATTVVLVAVRAAISLLQIGAFMLMLRGAHAGRQLGAMTLAGSAVLFVPEIGWRLAPTNTDPTTRWMLVGAYAVYAAVGIVVLTRSGRPSR